MSYWLFYYDTPLRDTFTHVFLLSDAFKVLFELNITILIFIYNLYINIGCSVCLTGSG